MSVWSEIPKRLIYLLIGLGVSFLLSFTLGFIWMIIKGIILGYGDSGPDWVNTVTEWIQIVSVVICLVLSQTLFNYVKKKNLN